MRTPGIAVKPVLIAIDYVNMASQNKPPSSESLLFPIHMKHDLPIRKFIG